MFAVQAFCNECIPVEARRERTVTSIAALSERFGRNWSSSLLRRLRSKARTYASSAGATRRRRSARAAERHPHDVIPKVTDTAIEAKLSRAFE